MSSDMVKQGRYLHFHNEMNTKSEVPGAAVAHSHFPAGLVAAVAHCLLRVECKIHMLPLVQLLGRCGCNHRSAGRAWDEG